jgi:hypothetical protein
MPRIGHRSTRLIAGDARWGLAGAVAAALPALWMWGFTVDDALISVRYARHVASGFGWRFNAHGPSTDGVTPLAWLLVLVPVGRSDPMAVLAYAQGVGAVAWTVASAALGVAIGRIRKAPWWGRAAALATVALSVPIAAYAVSGMETPLATALATVAVVVARRPLWAALGAGLAASLRPEMGPWACVLALGVALAARGPVDHAGRVAAAGAISLAPFVTCAVVRTLVWGHPAPLAVMAKPSDVEHGLAYAGAACVVTLTPCLALAPGALRRSRVGLAVVAAALAHVAAVIAVGGDWMPYARLMVPVAPSLAYAGVLASEHARPWATAARSAAALAVGVVLIALGGTAGRRVGPERVALVERARPLLAGVGRVAGLDIGWLGAATEADIVDLAGLTDPQIAALPGGHTSKRVDAIFLLARQPGALLLYASMAPPGPHLEGWAEGAYPRVVEGRLARDPVIARHFAATAWLPLGAPRAPGGDVSGYVLLAARPDE